MQSNEIFSKLLIRMKYVLAQSHPINMGCLPVQPVLGSVVKAKNAFELLISENLTCVRAMLLMVK